MKIAFWNLQENVPINLLSDFIQEQGIDLIALAESNGDPRAIQRNLLNRHGLIVTELGPSSRRIVFLTRFGSKLFRPILDTPFVSVREFVPPIGAPVLFMGCHLRSKLQSSDDDQSERALEIYRQFKAIEAAAGHRRSVVLGDFNMNPYENGMIGARSFHAVMDRRIAAKYSRRFDQEDRMYFYNPMWSLMGNTKQNARGTFFFDVARAHNSYWHTYDQVLVRPDLLSHFDDDSLSIVESIKGTSLLGSDSASINTLISDHLPITFTLKNL